MIVCTSLEKNFQTRFSDGPHEALSDTTAEHGGADAGFRPHDLLCAALGNCIAITTRMYAQKHGIALEGVTVSVELNRDDPAKAVFEYSLKYKGDIDDTTREKLARAAAACPVHKTLLRELVFRQV